MTNPIHFIDAPPDTFGEPVDEDLTECDCENPDDQYLLEIDAGSVVLTHRACGKQPRGDYLDLVELPRTPVTVKAEPYGNCDGQQWHGEHQCDCGNVLVVTVNDRAVLHDDRPYLVGRDYRDSDWEIWRITGDIDAEGRPLILMMPVGKSRPVPLGTIADHYGPLTLQPLTSKES